MSELNKAEVYEALHGPVWEEVKERLEAEKAQALQDICALDFSTPESNFDATGYQARMQTIDKIFVIINDIKESAKE